MMQAAAGLDPNELTVTTHKMGGQADWQTKRLVLHSEAGSLQEEGWGKNRTGHESLLFPDPSWWPSEILLGSQKQSNKF
jgi:hypothetical protein